VTNLSCLVRSAKAIVIVSDVFPPRWIIGV